MAVFTTARIGRRTRARHFASPRPRVDTGAPFDVLLIGIAASCAAFVRDAALGVSGHEWATFASARLAAHGGSLALFDALRTSDGAERLVSIAFATVEYALFGVDPVAYRIALDILVAGAGMSAYAAFRRCAVPRPIALATALLIGFLTDAVDVFGATRQYLGITFVLAGFHAALSLRGATPRRALGFAIASLAAVVAAALCSAATALLAVPIALALSRRGWTSRALAGAVVATVVAAFAYYGLVDGLPAWPALEERLGDARRILAGDACATFLARVDLGDFLVGSVAFAGTALAVLAVTLRRSAPSPVFAHRFAVAGTVVSVLGILGYVSGDAIAVRAGAAMSFVGVVASLAYLVRGSRMRAGILAAAVGIACGSAATVAASGADTTRESARLQARLIADVVDRTAGLPRGAAVLIAGRCPAATFVSDADATGALRLVLDRADVRAGVAGPAASGDATFGYDAFARRVVPLRDRGDVLRFLASAKREVIGCEGRP